MLETIEEFFLLILRIIAILILIAILIYMTPKIVDFLRPKTWTLFIYSTDLPNTDYLIQRIDGYRSQTECLERGFEITRHEGSYECGYGCRYRKEYKVEICDKVCTRFGCR